MKLYNADIDHGQGGDDTFAADDIDDAMRQAEAWAREAEAWARQGDWACTDDTVWVDLRVWPEDGDPEDGKYCTVAIHPEPPDCIDGDGHDWQSPFEVVGGIQDNPGVWGHGGGVIIKEYCPRCHALRITDTWAQRPSTGEQGLTSVSYDVHRAD